MSNDALVQPAPAKRGMRFILNPIYVVLVILLVAIAIKNPSFLEPTGYMNFLKRVAPIAIAASGQLFVIVAGGFDLSMGAVITFTVIGASMLIANSPEAVYWVIPLLFCIGGLIGLINGLVIVYLRVPSLIATLGMMITLGGVTLFWSGGAPKGYLPDAFRFFGRFNIPGVPGIMILPVSLIVLIVVVTLLWWLMHHTNYGRLLFAIGDNPRAARLAGVPVERVRIMAFVISSLSATTTGILVGGFSGVSPDAGAGYELQAITATVLGGAQLLGGRGSIPATVVGGATLAAIFTLLNFLGLPNPVRNVVQGLILIGAVALAMYRRKRTGQ
jgi:ribose transport system permease protein